MPRKPAIAFVRYCAAAIVALAPAHAARADGDAASHLPRQAETELSGVSLNDPQSARAPWDVTVEVDDPESDRPRAYVCNRDRSERVTLIFHEGDTAHVISEFRVDPVTTPHAECAVPEKPPAHFVTPKGVGLGMSRGELVQTLGRDYAEHREADQTVLVYRLDDRASGFLQRHSAPAYYGQYHFQGQRLVRFAFGFEFP